VAIGFSLGFGAMFSKTWRVHVIFLNATNTKRVITTASYKSPSDNIQKCL